MGGEFPHELRKGIWHTTNVSRYEEILRTGSILPNPPLPDCERWSTSAGSESYPFVRALGGVSLFDFRQFDPETYGEEYPMSSWREFVPYRRCWGVAVWLEVEHEKLGNGYLDTKALLARWHREKAQRHKIMPMIEAAHLGPIPLQVVSRVLSVSQSNPTFVEIGRPTQ
jgi:hypothetical protein